MREVGFGEPVYPGLTWTPQGLAEEVRPELRVKQEFRVNLKGWREAGVDRSRGVLTSWRGCGPWEQGELTSSCPPRLVSALPACPGGGS